jgi:hypothetical protein
MEYVLNYTNILNGNNYNFYRAAYFFGFGDDNYSSDSVRIVKLIYILISLILNLLIIISIIKKKKNKYSIGLLITGNILLINFIHTFSYSFEWVLKESDNNRTLYIDQNGEVINSKSLDSDYYEVGGLLVGNMNKIGACVTQGFFLVFSSICQDILINIFFFVINKPKIPSERKIKLYLILGYCIPILISIIYLLCNQFGLNDKFCYVKKFSYEKGKYKFNKYFPGIVMVIYTLRFFNLIISIYLLFQIYKYVKSNNIQKSYILKSSSILIIQIITISIGFIYRLTSAIDDKISRNIAIVFLYLNTLDGILFPLTYSLNNGIYRDLFGDSSKIESLMDDEEETNCIETTNNDSSINHTGANDKTFAMVDVKGYNNFDLSYA